MSYRVHITRPLPQIAVDLLKEAGYQVSVPNDDGLPSRDDMLESIKDAQGVLSILTEKIDEEVLEAAPGLKVVSNMAVGYDNIDVPAAATRGIVVTNTPNVLTGATAELTWALILAENASPLAVIMSGHFVEFMRARMGVELGTKRSIWWVRKLGKTGACIATLLFGELI